MEKILQHHRQNSLNFCEGLISRSIAEILLNIDETDSSQAEKWIKKSIEADTKYGLMWFLGNDYALYGNFFGSSPI